MLTLSDIFVALGILGACSLALFLGLGIRREARALLKDVRRNREATQDDPRLAQFRLWEGVDRDG
ncbi:hypothetical protein SAMN05444722_1718 [Rhodovulum sp. ES.010]|uniref:hypothetical protein n=1 Tax=Rhodovulum sp. ES.010 TaxID=1882821 RepID=UPI0009271F49|nr:hypothetical protein [Rhodovulum sp. ES.010]SIO37010.1 hypothetical protein SAMN05444722_1718 [Rhodovulum sp. ES.010]